jgi:hypothetical protein
MPRSENKSRFTRGNKYDRAVRTLSERAKKRPLTPLELVRKGQLIQLSDQGSPRDAAAALLKALRIDASYLPALVELGWFAHVVDADLKAGMDYFDRAIGLAVQILDEAATGKASCLELMQTEARGERFLKAFRSASIAAIKRRYQGVTNPRGRLSARKRLT